MDKRYLALEGDTFSSLAERLYKIVQPDGAIQEKERGTVERALRHANPGLEFPLHAGDEVVLPPVTGIGWVDLPRIEEPDDLRPYARQIAGRINGDRVLGVLFLADPARVLAELGYELSGKVKALLRRSMFGVTRAQMDEYDFIKQRMKNGEVISGFVSVRLHPSEAGRLASPAGETGETGTPEQPPHNPNPVDGYDVVIEIAEEVVERVAQLLYEDNVIPHRPDLPPDLAQDVPGQLVLGRPQSISFNTATPNGIVLVLPVALVMPSSAYSADISVEAVLTVEKQNDRPDHFQVTLTKDPVALGSGPQVAVINILLPALKPKLEAALNAMLQKFALAAELDKLVQSSILSKMNASVDDLDLKINNPPAPGSTVPPRRSVSVCVDFSPHNGAGQAQNVGQFMAEQWAIGVNERMLHQVFTAWWNSPDAKQYQRLNKSKLEDFQNLSQQHRLSEIFDPNGAVRITGIEFSCRQNYIDLTVDLKVGDVWLWDVDATVTGKVEFAIDPITSNFQITVTDVDTSLSCLSKFLIGLFCFTMGFIGGAIVGGIVGAVIGGTVGGILAGAVVGTGIGAAVGGLISTIIGSVILALELAAVNGKLNNLDPITILKAQFSWQIPQTTMILDGRGKWATVLPGEVLMGGEMVMPPLYSPEVDILCSQWSESRTSGVLPWDNRPLYSAGYYFNNVTARYLAKPKFLLEEPLSFKWSMDGVEIAGDGDEVELTITTSLNYTLEPKADGKAVVLTPTGVRIQKSIQVIKTDGSKGPPLIFTEFLGEVGVGFTAYTLKVGVTDVLGVQAQAELHKEVTVLGNSFVDFFNFVQGYRAIAQIPLGPQPPESMQPIPGLAGLATGVSEVADAKAAFRRPELIVNIPGAKYVTGKS